MQNNWKTILAVTAALGITAVGLVGCGGGSSGGNRVVVTVSGKDITEGELYNYLKTKGSVRVLTDQGQMVEARVADSLAYQAMQELIAQKVTIALAEKEGVKPSDADVNSELDFQKRLDPQFVQKLTANGVTLAQIKSQLLVEMCRERIITKGVTITKADAEKYIKDNPKAFVNPATADMYVVVVKSEAKKQQVDNELRSGQNFQTVAMRYSEAPKAREMQARFSLRAIDSMPAELKTIVQKTNVKQATDWIKSADSWAKFYVDNKEAEKPIAMNADLIERVRRSLAVQRGSQAVDLARRLLDELKNSGSKIQVKDKSLQEIWNKGFQEFLQNDKAATSPTSNLNSATGSTGTAGTKPAAGGDKPTEGGASNK